MDKQLLDLYADYLTSSFSYTTATGLSQLLDGAISHDRITRFLSAYDFDSAQLWELVKPAVRRTESADAALIIDDSIEEKPYTDESALITWHYDHTKGRSVKGVNFLSALYYSAEVSIPVAFELVKKTKTVVDPKTQKTVKKSEITKNEHYRQMLKVCVRNQIPFKYVINDVWFSSTENMTLVKEQLKKDFVMPIKANRLIAFNIHQKLQGQYVQVQSADLKPHTLYTIYLPGIAFPLVLLKQVFKNEDDSEGILYLVCSDLTMTYDQITTLYQKRWKVEEYHKSLKSNASFSRSPTKTIRTQQNHFFASIYAFFRLEQLKTSSRMNHFALRAKLYMKAAKTAYDELKALHYQYDLFTTPSPA